MVVDIRTWVKNVVNNPNNNPTTTIPCDENTSDCDLLTTTTLESGQMAAKAVLICRPNSHPFQERTLTLDEAVKVGRSVARARATPTNAIFDCKVLSRHHALLWYENGKFYLQDTKSSNGTFVNNNRLSAGGIESAPHEVCSGDIVQFGVDVVENNRKVTHGCIVATLKLYLHDGKEAKASHSLTAGSGVGTVPLDELYKLNQYLQDAMQREQLLEVKLNALQSLVEQARVASNTSWQAFIGEDRLLSRVEILETQLLSYSKNYSEDKMREELLKLQEDKNAYQNSAKESLRKLHQERLDAIAKLTELQQTVATTEQEMSVCNEQQIQAQNDLQDLAQRYSTNQQNELELRGQLAGAEERERETEQRRQELLYQINTQNNLILNLHKQVDKLQQDKFTLETLITELDKCTVNNCPVDLQFKVDKIVQEFESNQPDANVVVDADENTNLTKLEPMENVVNNVPYLNETESEKLYGEHQDGSLLSHKQIEELLVKLQAELKQLQDSTEENDNKIDDLDKLREQITHWTIRLIEVKKLETSDKMGNKDIVDNSQYVKQFESDELRNKLRFARNEVTEKQAIITKLSEEVTQLLQSSALVNVKMNLMENDFIKSKHETEQCRQESEMLREQLTETECKLKKWNEDKKQLVNGNGGKPVIEDETKFIELEEELVLMKERYAECNIDKLRLNKNFDQLQKQYNALANRSHNVLFLYVAPLILLLLYFFVSSLFSS